MMPSTIFCVIIARELFPELRTNAEAEMPTAKKIGAPTTRSRIKVIIKAVILPPPFPHRA